MPIRAPKGFIDESDPAVSQVGHPAPPWLAPYADLMTEMVCFFVILYALSAALDKNVQKAAADVKQTLDEGGLKGQVKIDREGLKISLEEQGDMAFFESGYSDITPKLQEVIEKLAPKLRQLAEKYELIIEGHTDNRPINNDYFGSNWELSTARATSVLEYLVHRKGFPSNKLGAIGYGEHRPVAPNDTPANRARNRRVVFFVKTLGQVAQASEAAAGPRPPPAKKP